MTTMRAILIREFGRILTFDFSKIISIFSLGDANVCKVVRDVPIPDVQAREVC